MKSIIYPLLTTLFLVCLTLSCKNHYDTKISVTENDDLYKFTAYYDDQKTEDIQEYLRKSLAPSNIFDSDDEVDKTVILDDRTKFKLEFASGELLIRLDKNENNSASYERIKQMAAGVKRIIGE